MNRLYSLRPLILIGAAAHAQTPAKGTVPAPKSAAAGYRIKYDHAALRIPGNKFAVGLIVPPDGKKAADTIGYPEKGGGWGKYHVDVDSGSFSGGNVKLRQVSNIRKTIL